MDAPPPPAAGSATAVARAGQTVASRLADYRGLLWLIAASFFMQTLDSTIVNTAVPSIAEALRITPLSLRTALTSYVLTLAICIPASPWLTDRFGTRRVFAVSIAVFTLGSAACGLAQSLPELIAARVLQGLGGALLMPVGRYVLVRAFDKRDFVAAMSLVSIPGLLGPVLGPLLGGAFSEYLSWRLIFLVNVPVGIVGWWLNRRAMPEIRDPQRPFDGIGFVLFALASGLLLTAAEFASEDQLAIGGAAALAGAVAAALYWAHSQRTAHPINDLALLKIRSFWIAVGGSLFTRLGVSGMPFVFALFLQVGCGWSPLAAGLMMMPQALAMMAMKLLIDPLLKRYGYRRTLYVNTVLVAILLGMFALLTAQTPWPWMALLNFAYGLVMSLQYTAMNTLAFVDLQPAQAGHASSMTSTAQYLSMSFGIALASMLMSAYVGPHRQLAAAYVSGFRFSAVVLALLTLVGAFIFTRLRRDRALRVSVDTPETAS